MLTALTDIASLVRMKFSAVKFRSHIIKKANTTDRFFPVYSARTYPILQKAKSSAWARRSTQVKRTRTMSGS